MCSVAIAGTDIVKTLIAVTVWCVLLVLCWPLAVLALDFVLTALMFSI